jgi:hypothetical protein
MPPNKGRALGGPVGRRSPTAFTPHPLGPQDLVELHGELAVVVAQQHPRLVHVLGEVHGRAAGVLRHPRRAQLGGDPRQVEPPGADLHTLRAALLGELLPARHPGAVRPGCAGRDPG